MAALKTPVICTVIGEGGSGGALAIGMGDRLFMCENSWYSVISPEGCAAILFRDATQTQEAATALKLTAPKLKAIRIVDTVIPEAQGGAHHNPALTMDALKAQILKNFDVLQNLTTEQLLDQRYQRFRTLGAWRDAETEKASRRKPARVKSA
jgi:acetyl-CoA carboxylase carboxyl transferase subunit alpha